MSSTAGRLSARDGLRVASVGLRARPLRAALSALGIAIGTAAIVAILAGVGATTRTPTAVLIPVESMSIRSRWCTRRSST